MKKTRSGTARRSDRVRMLKSFSKYTNTKDTAIMLNNESSDSDRGVFQDKSTGNTGETSGSVKRSNKRGTKRKQSDGGGSDQSMTVGRGKIVRKSPRLKTIVGIVNDNNQGQADNESKDTTTKNKAVVKKVHPTIRIRTSPNTLYRALHGLSTIQRKCIVQMGFGKMLTFDITELPSRLAYHVVNCFDDKNLVIKVGDRVIEVTTQVIHEMLGIPLGGGIKLSSMGCETTENSIIEDWKKQNGGKEVTAVELKDRIVGSGMADWNFKINFIVLFANIMGGCVKRSYCDLSMLRHIRADTDFKKIDWCQFLLESMENCKRTWKPGNSDKHYAGPCTLLTLIYVDATKSNKFDVARQRPAILAWNTEKLKSRERAEVESGGFGLVEMRDPSEAEPDSDGGKTSSDAEDDIKSLGIYSYIPDGEEGYVHKIETLYGMLMRNKKHLQSTAKEALDRYPGNIKIREWGLKLDGLFEHESVNNVDRFRTPNNMNKPTVGTSSAVIGDKGGSSEKVGETEVFTTPNEHSLMIIAAEEVGQMNTNEDGGQPDLDKEPLSQFWVDPVVQEAIENSFERCPTTGIEKLKRVVKCTGERAGTIMEVENTNLSIPSFSLGLTQQDDIGDGNERVVEAKRSGGKKAEVELGKGKQVIGDKMAQNVRECRRRATKNADTCRSPYWDRVVDVDSRLTADETKVLRLLEEEEGKDTDVMFQTKHGDNALRINISSLLQNFTINAHVLTCWAALLNLEEHKRSRDSPNRLFCYAGMLNNIFRDKSMDDGQRMTVFTSKLSEVVNSDNEQMKLADVDMVFFPMVAGWHYYLIVFDLRHGEIDIVDNQRDIVRNGAKYKSSIRILTNVFKEYLKHVGNAKCDRFLKAVPTILEMKWQTTKNEVDCGVFVMRHMETYMGETGSKWDCGLEVEGKAQKAKLAKMRKRYALKLILSEHNVMREMILQRAKKYDAKTRMDPKKK